MQRLPQIKALADKKGGCKPLPLSRREPTGSWVMAQGVIPLQEADKANGRGRSPRL